MRPDSREIQQDRFGVVEANFHGFAPSLCWETGSTLGRDRQRAKDY